MMEYKGYIGHVVYDDEAEIFHGDVINIRDVVTFQGTTVEEIKQAFRDSVEDYLDFCIKLGQVPNKPFSGKFMVRIPPDLHRKAYESAIKAGKSLNAWVTDRLSETTAHAH
jgi:predicted HicB family RNase H-like nuclease